MGTTVRVLACVQARLSRLGPLYGDPTKDESIVAKRLRKSGAAARMWPCCTHVAQLHTRHMGRIPLTQRSGLRRVVNAAIDCMLYTVLYAVIGSFFEGVSRIGSGCLTKTRGSGPEA